MMIGDDEPVDPLVDPFGTIDNDPLRHYKRNGYHHDTSSSDEDLSSYRIPSSLTIIPSSSAGGLKVHKIPAYTNSVTITRVDPPSNGHQFLNRTGYNFNTSVLQLSPPKRVGRKKGSKNKFRKGVRIDALDNGDSDNGLDLTTKMKNILKENFGQTELSMHLNSYAEMNTVSKPKRKYVKKSKLEMSLNGKYINDLNQHSPVPSYVDPSVRLVVEVDPSELFPDDPMPRDKVYRKRRKGTEDRLFECDICKKGFKCVRGVQTHKSVKHGIEDLSGYYPCEICEEVFALKRDLTCHYVTHQNVAARLPCPETGCNITEPDISSLVKHKKRMHPHLGTLGRTWFHTWGDR